MTPSEMKAVIKYVNALEGRAYWDEMARAYAPAVAVANLGPRPNLPPRPAALGGGK